MQRGLKPKKVVCLLFVPGWVRAMSPLPSHPACLELLHVCVCDLGLGWPEEMVALASRFPLGAARISGSVSGPVVLIGLIPTLPRPRTSSQRLQALDYEYQEHGIEPLLGYSGFSLSLNLGVLVGETEELGL